MFFPDSDPEDLGGLITVVVVFAVFGVVLFSECLSTSLHILVRLVTLRGVTRNQHAFMLSTFSVAAYVAALLPRFRSRGGGG